MTWNAWHLTIASQAAAEALNEPEHVVQVRAVALAPSRAAFARLLIASGLSRGSERSVAREIATYGGQGGSRDDLAEGVVYVEPLNRRPGDPMIPWEARR